MEDYFEIVRQVLIPMFYKEAQLGRSLRVDNQELKKQVFNSCLELAKKVLSGKEMIASKKHSCNI